MRAIGKSVMKNGAINEAHPFPGRWLPLVVFAALILVLSGALFGLVVIHDHAGTSLEYRPIRDGQ